MHARAGVRSALSFACALVLLVSGLVVTPPPATALPFVRINEIRSDQEGTDNDEYAELFGTPGMSLAAYTLIAVGDGTGGSGVIESVVSLAGQTMPADGYFLIAENTFTMGTPDMLAGTSLNFENGDNVTHMLVVGFSGTLGDDLDPNDDGTFDVTPWTGVVDRVALIIEENPPVSTEWHYGPPTVGPDGLLAAAHAYRNSSGWHLGTLSITSGLDTPGSVNPDEPWALEDPGRFTAVTEADSISVGANDAMGWSVAVDGDLAVVGASSGGPSSEGIALIYERAASGWTLVQEISAVDGGMWDYFGGAVAIAGETIFVGAIGQTQAGYMAGAVYVFTRSGDTWVQSDKLLPGDAAPYQSFGQSLAASGDTLLVGSYADDPYTDAGAVYVFEPDGGAWTEQQRLTAPDAAADDRFGFRVALSGDTALVSAPFDDGVLSDSGSAYTFTRTGGVWTFEDKLTPSFEQASNYAGYSIAIDGDAALMGIPNDDVHIGDGGGAAYFTRSGSEWTEQAVIAPKDIATYDGFGVSVALDGAHALIGAYSADTESVTDCGAVYTFDLVSGQWIERDRILAPVPGAMDQFGWAVAISGDCAVVGARSDSTLGSGAGTAYFLESAYVTAEDTPFSRFDPEGLLDNDISNGAEVTAVLHSLPSHGSLDLTSTGEFTYTPDPDFWGTDTFAYRAYDGLTYSLPATVTITVTPVNDAPSFTAGGDVTVAEDSGACSAPWASAISAGAPDEALQELAFSVDVADPTLFAALPEVAQDGTLSFTPAADAFGSSDVGVWLTDDDTAGGDALSSAVQTFTITVSDTYDFPLGATRVSGDNRYETAIEGSLEAFADGAETVVIATAANWPDALGGSALAGAVKGPLLLTKQDDLPDAVADEIDRLEASDVYILGGEAAVSAAVEGQLETLLGSGHVQRLAGANRYETARLVADEVIDLAGPGFSGDAFVATGANFPDALAASPLAAARLRPILLANPRTGAVSRPAAVTDVMILGGTGAVSASVESALETQLGATHVDRIGGANRYDTAAQVAAYGAGLGMTWNGLGIATGKNFPDGLSGGAMLGRLGSVMLLTPPDTLAPEAKAALEDHAAEIDSAFIIGGTAAVNDDVEAAIKAALGM